MIFTCYMWDNIFPCSNHWDGFIEIVFFVFVCTKLHNLMEVYDLKVGVCGRICYATLIHFPKCVLHVFTVVCTYCIFLHFCL
jgi:hypothetical protein